MSIRCIMHIYSCNLCSTRPTTTRPARMRVSVKIRSVLLSSLSCSAVRTTVGCLKWSRKVLLWWTNSEMNSCFQFSVHALLWHSVCSGVSAVFQVEPASAFDPTGLPESLSVYFTGKNTMEEEGGVCLPSFSFLQSAHSMLIFISSFSLFNVFL